MSRCHRLTFTGCWLPFYRQQPHSNMALAAQNPPVYFCASRWRFRTRLICTAKTWNAWKIAGRNPGWFWLAKSSWSNTVYHLYSGDCRLQAKTLSCHQPSPATALLAWNVCRIQWNYRSNTVDLPSLVLECGLIGQVLYLEAEAAGIRGTGIGCYFDDSVHELLGSRMINSKVFIILR